MRRPVSAAITLSLPQTSILFGDSWVGVKLPLRPNYNRLAGGQGRTAACLAGGSRSSARHPWRSEGYRLVVRAAQLNLAEKEVEEFVSRAPEIIHPTDFAFLQTLAGK